MERPATKDVWAFARRIHPVFVLLNWQWGAPGYVPSVGEIARGLESHIGNVVSGETTICYSGGLFAELDEDREIVFGFRMEHIG